MLELMKSEPVLGSSHEIVCVCKNGAGAYSLIRALMEHHYQRRLPNTNKSLGSGATSAIPFFVVAVTLAPIT